LIKRYKYLFAAFFDRTKKAAESPAVRLPAGRQGMPHYLFFMARQNAGEIENIC